MTDLFLFNGFTPLRRSPADVFLDNGIGMLRAALLHHDIDFIIEDRTSLDEIAKFNCPQISALLRPLLKKQIFGKEPLTGDEKSTLNQYHEMLLHHHETEMNSYINAVAKRVAEQQIPVVGIKLWAGSTYKYCVALCQQIHQLSPNTVVVVGGPQVNCFSFEGMILKLSPFDVAVYSEGEEALVQIVKRCISHRCKSDRLIAIAAAKIPNSIFRSENVVVVSPMAVSDINKKRVPVYPPLQGKVGVHMVVDALGCDFAKCTFCIHPQIYPCFRKREPKRIVDEIEHMIRQGIGLFSFTASDTPLSHAVKISEEILSRKLKLEYGMLTRAKKNAHKQTEKITSQFRVLIRAGLKTVFFGVESGNDEVLKQVMNKGVNVQDIVTTVRCLRKASELENASVNIIASFIYPVPLPNELIDIGVTNESIMEDNLKLVARMKPDSFHAAPGLLYPGTDWYCQKEKYNIQYDDETFLAQWISQEFSYHGFIALDDDFLYSFNGVPFQQLILASMEFARRGNQLGIPSDLWEEQFIFAHAAHIEGKEALLQLSQELFLDLLTCNDTHSRYLYDQAHKHSQALAQSNTHLMSP